jgi:hypothetical protein
LLFISRIKYDKYEYDWTHGFDLKADAMKCEKAQKYIPDLRTGRISTRQAARLKDHLATCDKCAAWLENWAQICEVGREALIPPPSLDWTSFDTAIETELRRNPRHGRQRFAVKELKQFLSGLILNYPRKTTIRLGASVAVAAAVVLFIFSRPLPPEPERGHLILGEGIISAPQGDLVTYKNSETNHGYYHEVISLNLVEGNEY